MPSLQYMNAAPQSNNLKPDFTFPENVSKKAAADLEKSLSSGDDIGALRALINLTLAQNAISSDRMPEMLSRIDSLTQAVESPDAQSLLYLLQARIYSDIYNSERYVISNRPTPAGNRPADYKVWSGEQFSQCIIELCNAALGDERALLRRPLSDYKSLLNYDKLTFTFYPRLYDFVVTSAIGMLDGLATSQSLSLAKEFRSQRIAYTRNDSAPYVINMIDDISNEDADNNDVRFDALLKLYHDLGNSQYRIEAAIAMARMTFGNVDREKTVYRILNFLVKSYPGYPRFNCLVNEVSALSRPELNVSVPAVASPDFDLKFTARASNLREATVTVYRIPDSSGATDSYYRPTQLSTLPVVATLPMKFSGSVPFEDTDTVSLRLPSPGYYIAVTKAPGVTVPKKQSYRIIQCSRLATGIVTFDSSSAVVVDPVTGSPVSGAEIMWLPPRKVARFVSQTDSAGFAPVGLKEDARLQAVKGSDSYSPAVWFYHDRFDRKNTFTNLQGYTSLSVYHPGDSVEWAFIAYSLDNKNYSPCRGREVKVTMIDANGQEVESSVFTTDDFGRIQGSFEIPTQGLNGSFSLRGELDGSFGFTRFMVSDYKMPTFEVKITDSATGVPEKGAVTLKGVAMTYSGMPLADAVVNITITKEMMWWRFSDSMFVPIKVEARTDRNGEWQAVVSPSQLATAKPDDWLKAEVSVTSVSGEMQQAFKVFAMGSPLKIKQLIGSSLDVSKPCALDVKVVNTTDSVVPSLVDYQLVDSRGQVVATGSLMTPDSTVVDWSDIKTGMYSVKFILESDTVTTSGVAIYKPADTVSPSDELLWTPENALTLGPDTEQDIILGTLPGMTHVLYTLWDGDGVYDQRWIDLEGGLHRIHMKGPHGAANLTATFIAVRDMTNCRLDVSLKTKVNPRAMKMKIETMRDNLLPGSEEKWTLSVANSQNIPVESAVLAEMYNKALDVIASPSGWSLNVLSPSALYLGWRSPSLSDHFVNRLSLDRRVLKCSEIIRPSFDLYGYSFGMQTFRRYARAMALGAVETAEDEADEITNVVEHKMALAAAPRALNSAMMKSDAVVEEALDESAVTADEGGSSDPMSGQNAKADYRDANVTLAFFRPMLRTDHNGKLSIEFTVPKANATWVFRAFAYAADMRTAAAEATVVSQKPVMVKPNPPRFLRQGDEATFITAVMNATDQSRTVNFEADVTTINGMPVANEKKTIVVEGKSTAYIPVKAVAGEVAGLILKVKAESDDFTDGERVLIPVLEATTPVIESKPVYMAPDQHLAEIDLDAAPQSVTTVEFCANPEWYVVTALPGLRKGDLLTAPAAADAIFSCAVAEGILRDYPVIAEAIDEWTSSDRSEVALTSMLSRNEDMKTLLLNSTPWMMDAQSQTERMERLALLFDKHEVKATYAKAIGLLSKLMKEDGGWAWISQSHEPSLWATRRVLSILGSLNTLGYFPDNQELKKMVVRAVGYLDAEAKKQVSEYPESDMTSFTLLRDLYPDIKASTDIRRIMSGAVQKCVAEWKKWPLSAKPQAAMMLYRHNYATVSHEILESMSQYSERSPEKGMWFPSLENNAYGYLTFTSDALQAYNMIEPDSSAVDGLRQWLILQKQATEWGSSSSASELIASIIKSSKRVNPDAGNVAVIVNGRDLKLSDIDRRLGYLRSNVETGNLPARIEFRKSGDSAAWGSVMRRSRKLITDVKADGVEDLQIEKTLILPQGKTEIEVGDRLTVQLTLRVGRNMNYVTIVDNRAAFMEPVDQTPFTRFSEGVTFYMEPRDASTNIFVTTMPKGTYVLTYDVVANNAGSYASGIATVQCQQAAELTAHSAGSTLIVNSKN